ncbi:helix-turn-helix domain-containing protein [Burkholderia gladioli]|uniref:helix-turn-helix domain-containing protein n=1 Tax=Burkholderia gladioli TaxID=28095 RepID=UPI0034DB105A
MIAGKDGRAGRRLSASNLPDDFKIKNAREYVQQFRNTILGAIRQSKGLSLTDVTSAVKISEQDLSRVEAGNVTEADISLLHKLAKLYDLEYAALLKVFKLATRASNEASYKLAAYHDPKLGKNAQDAIAEFLGSLKK